MTAKTPTSLTPGQGRVASKFFGNVIEATGRGLQQVLLPLARGLALSGPRQVAGWTLSAESFDAREIRLVFRRPGEMRDLCLHIQVHLLWSEAGQARFDGLLSSVQATLRDPDQRRRFTKSMTQMKPEAFLEVGDFAQDLSSWRPVLEATEIARIEGWSFPSQSSWRQGCPGQAQPLFDLDEPLHDNQGLGALEIPRQVPHDLMLLLLELLGQAVRDAGLDEDLQREVDRVSALMPARKLSAPAVAGLWALREDGGVPGAACARMLEDLAGERRQAA